MIDLPQLISHRGANRVAPENTLAAFRQAQTAGVRWIELDVRLTADGIPVVIHDDTLDRTTAGHGLVSLATWDTLKKLNAGAWFSPAFAAEPLPSLADCLRLAAELALGINVELKTIELPFVEKMVRAILQVVQPFQMQVPLLFSSFSRDLVMELRKQSMSVELGLLLDEDHPIENSNDDLWEFLQQWRIFTLHLPQSLATPAIIAQAKKHGHPVVIYTVNDVEQARTFLRWGAAAIISDFPDLLDETLNQLGS